MKPVGRVCSEAYIIDAAARPCSFSPSKVGGAKNLPPSTKTGGVRPDEVRSIARTSSAVSATEFRGRIRATDRFSSSVIRSRGSSLDASGWSDEYSSAGSQSRPTWLVAGASVARRGVPPGALVAPSAAAAAAMIAASHARRMASQPLCARSRSPTYLRRSAGLPDLWAYRAKRRPGLCVREPQAPGIAASHGSASTPRRHRGGSGARVDSAAPPRRV